MQSKRIKYIAAFDIDINRAENRSNILSSANKINYIIETLNKIGYAVDVISTSQTLNRKCYPGKILKWGINTIKYFPSTWRGGVLLKMINLIVMHLCFFNYILFHIRKKDIVIMYHSYGTMWMYPIIKLKGAKLHIECEEIYGDIFNKKWMSYIEKKSFKFGDSFIYPTKLLDKVVNTKNKSNIVVHGAYKDLGDKFFSDNKEESILFDPNVYHVAYTGILDPRKGCLDLVKAAQYLDSSYHIHILGFGSKEEIEGINKTINEVKGKSQCKISYDGVRKGKEYSFYLSNINLGICTLDYNQKFVNTQFPSKIISYMAAGVPVLCSETPAILTCDVAGGIIFYKGTSPYDIAQGIREAREKKYSDPRYLLNKCDETFLNQLSNLLKE